MDRETLQTGNQLAVKVDKLNAQVEDLEQVTGISVLSFNKSDNTSFNLDLTFLNQETINGIRDTLFNSYKTQLDQATEELNNL